MTCGELVTKTSEIFECREHDLLSCKECLEVTARDIGLKGWNMVVTKASGIEQSLNELNLVSEEGSPDNGTH